MQLPNFIQRMLGFADKVEKALDATVKNLEAQITSSTKDVADRDKTIADTRAQLATANSSITAKDGEITQLKADVETAKASANETLAKAGIAAEDLPPAEAKNDNGGAVKETAWQTYIRLQATDARAAGEFYAKNGDHVLATRPKD